MAETTETAIAAHTARDVSEISTFGVIASTARIEPGDAGETNTAGDSQREYASHTPRITARIRRGFIQHIREVDFVDTPRKWMIAAPPADCLALPRPKNMYASSTPTRTWVSFNQEEDGLPSSWDC